MSKGWYKTGNEGYETAQRIQEELKDGYAPFRFFLKPGASAKVTFLDTEGFYFHEHMIQVNNKWTNYTCLRDFSECPICDSGDRPGYVCAYTVIDHSRYEGKNGIVQNTKKLLVVRPAVMNKLARRRETLEGNLAYCVFLFSRDSKNECATGEDIEHVKRVNPQELAKVCNTGGKLSDADFLKPFDYMTIFAPKSVDELRKIVGQAPVGSDNYSRGRDDMPPPESGSVSESSIEDLL